MRTVPRESPDRGAGILCDTPERDYSTKLRLFNAFAEREIRQAISTLDLQPGMRVLDAGCGTGEALGWMYDLVRPSGSAVGVDLSQAHIDAARRHLPPQIELLRGDLLDAICCGDEFDLIWTVNTINHLRDPCEGVRRLAQRLRPRGRIAVGQSHLLPDMFFAWDSRLERVTTEAVRRYYRDRYALREQDLAAVRSLVGVLRRAGLRQVTSRTLVIERIAPVEPDTEAYVRQAIFRDTWGERLRPYMSAADFASLAVLTDPNDASFALRRADFHLLQTLTLALGEI
jgi:SAM-dependent methyltransferase